jgi:hypothetical protein
MCVPVSASDQTKEGRKERSIDRLVEQQKPTPSSAPVCQSVSSSPPLQFAITTRPSGREGKSCFRASSLPRRSRRRSRAP